MISVWPSALRLCNKNLWFAHGVLNAVFSYSLEYNELNYIGYFPKQNVMHEYPYFGGAVQHGNLIYFVPFYGDYIGVLNMNKKELSNLEISYGIKRTGAKYCNGFIYDDFLFCIPYDPNVEMIKIDTQSGYVEELPNFKKTMKSNGAIYIDKTIRVGNEKIMGVVGETGKIFEYNLKNDNIQLFEIEDGIIDTYYYDSDLFYVHLKDKDITCRVSIEKDRLVVRDLLEVELDNTLLLCDSGKYIISDTTTNGDFECFYNDIKEIFRGNVERNGGEISPQTGLGVCGNDGENVYYVNRFSCEVMDMQTKKIHKLLISDEDEKKLKKYIGSQKTLFIHESQNFSVADFVGNI